MAESSSNNEKSPAVKAKKKATKKKPARKKSPRVEKSTATQSSAKAGAAEAAPTAKAMESSAAETASSTSSTSTSAPVSSSTHAAGNGVGNGKGNGLSWLAILISLVALAAGGYAWYTTAIESRLTAGSQENRFGILEQRFDGFDTAQSDLSNLLNQLRGQITQAEDNINNQIRTIRGELSEQDSALREQIRNAENMLEAREAEFRTDFETLSDSIVAFRSELGRGVDSWTLEEAEQLIYIANQRLQFSGDVELAKAALQQADGRLRDMANPALGNVRQALASEISALENLERVDTAGVLAAISALSGRIKNLSLSGDLEDPGKTTGGGADSESTAEAGQASEDASGYLQPVIDAGADLLSSLGDLIQVEKNGEAINPVISSEVRQLIYAKGQLILESAQIAFIRQMPDLYQQRMAEAREWVEQNFKQDSEVTQSWLNELDSIATSVPDTSLPDISGSLEAIRQVINKQNQG